MIFRDEIIGISKDWFDYEGTNRMTFLKDDKGLPIQKHGAYQVIIIQNHISKGLS